MSFYNTESDKIIDMIKLNDTDISDSRIIFDIIKGNYRRDAKLKKLWDEYLGDVEIKNRKDKVIKGKKQPNAKLQHPFRSIIVDSKLDVFLVNEIGYNYDTTKYTQVEINTIDSTIKKFRMRNKLQDLDYEIGKLISVCGYAFRSLYINKNGDEMVYNLYPWQTHIEIDQEMMETTLGITYYTKTRMINKKPELRYWVEYYDKSFYKLYTQSDDGKEFILQQEKLHMFNKVPIIKISNNLPHGDFEQVRALIDDYDFRQSDVSNELADNRNSYKYIKTRAKIDSQKIDEFEDSRTVKLGQEDDIGFIIKTLSSEYKESHLTRLENDIYKLTSTVDFYDNKLESGTARTLRLYNMLNKIKSKERKFTDGLLEMFDLLLTPWSIKKIPLKLEDMDFQFHENLPDFTTVEDAIKAVTTELMSRKTAMEKIGIEDANAELKEIQEEKEQYGITVNLDSIQDN